MERSIGGGAGHPKTVDSNCLICVTFNAIAAFVDTSHVLIDLDLVLVEHRRDELLKLLAILGRRDRPRNKEIFGAL